MRDMNRQSGDQRVLAHSQRNQATPAPRQPRIQHGHHKDDRNATDAREQVVHRRTSHLRIHERVVRQMHCNNERAHGEQSGFQRREEVS